MSFWFVEYCITEGGNNKYQKPKFTNVNDIL